MTDLDRGDDGAWGLSHREGDEGMETDTAEVGSWPRMATPLSPQGALAVTAAIT
jgi:hypothetical protein